VEGPGILDMMALGVPGQAACQAMHDHLVAAGVDCTISTDIMKDIWEKLAFNNVTNCITAISRLRVGPMFTSSYGYTLAELIVREVVGVAAAEGVAADYDAVMDTMTELFVPDKDWNHITSMLADVLAERRTEIDSIVGTVILKGKKHGIPTPTLLANYNYVKLIEENYDIRV